MSDEDYREFRRHAIDHLSFSPAPGPDHAHDMIIKGQAWAMLTLAEAIHDGTAALDR